MDKVEVIPDTDLYIKQMFFSIIMKMHHMQN